MKYFFNLFFLNFKISLYNINNFGTTIFFYLLSVCLFPLSLGEYFYNNTTLIITTLWINIILSILLTLDIIFKEEYQKGILDFIIVTSKTFHIIILTKILIHLIIIILPLIIITPFLGIFFGLTYVESIILFFSLILASPALIMLGMIGTSLTITLSKGGILLTILILPLYIPILIFGTTSVITLQYGTNIVLANLSMLTAISSLCFLFIPTIIIIILKIGILS